jgi:hypothetical protein
MPKRTIRGDGKKQPLNMRTTAALRKKIEKAAGASGRSLVQEVEYRVEQTFHGDEALCEIALLKRDLIGMLNVLAGRLEQLRQAQAKSESFWRDVVVAQQHMGKSMDALRDEVGLFGDRQGATEQLMADIVNGKRNGVLDVAVWHG